MDLITTVKHTAGAVAIAFVSAYSIRDVGARAHTVAGLQMAESGSVPFLQSLSDRAQGEGDRWLAGRLALHAQDEKRHGAIFAQALKRMGKSVVDLSLAQPEDDRRRSPFFVRYFEGYEREDLRPERIDWIVFMASTHILEIDASIDFHRMAMALPDGDPQLQGLRQGMISIAEDERRHAAYLKQGLGRWLAVHEVDRLLDRWRGRKAEAMVAMVGYLLEKRRLPQMAQDGMAA